MATLAEETRAIAMRENNRTQEARFRFVVAARYNFLNDGHRCE